MLLSTFALKYLNERNIHKYGEKNLVTMFSYIIPLFYLFLKLQNISYLLFLFNQLPNWPTKFFVNFISLNSSLLFLLKFFLDVYFSASSNYSQKNNFNAEHMKQLFQVNCKKKKINP